MDVRILDHILRQPKVERRPVTCKHCGNTGEQVSVYLAYCGKCGRYTAINCGGT